MVYRADGSVCRLAVCRAFQPAGPALVHHRRQYAVGGHWRELCPVYWRPGTGRQPGWCAGHCRHVPAALPAPAWRGSRHYRGAGRAGHPRAGLPVRVVAGGGQLRPHAGHGPAVQQCLAPGLSAPASARPQRAPYGRPPAKPAPCHSSRICTRPWPRMARYWISARRICSPF